MIFLSRMLLVPLLKFMVCIYNLVIFSCLQLMALVASTLVDLVKNLRAFAGILVVSVNGALRRLKCHQ